MAAVDGAGWQCRLLGVWVGVCDGVWVGSSVDGVCDGVRVGEKDGSTEGRIDGWPDLRFQTPK